MIEGAWLYSKGRGDAKRTLSRPWCHPSLNEWAMRTLPVQSNVMKKAWAAKIAQVVRHAGSPRLAGPVAVAVTTYFENKRRRDIDNYAPKFILDGLVEAGVIPGDDSETVAALVVVLRVDAHRPRTEIEIREHV